MTVLIISDNDMNRAVRRLAFCNSRVATSHQSICVPCLRFQLTRLRAGGVGSGGGGGGHRKLCTGNVTAPTAAVETSILNQSAAINTSQEKLFNEIYKEHESAHHFNPSELLGQSHLATDTVKDTTPDVPVKRWSKKSANQQAESERNNDTDFRDPLVPNVFDKGGNPIRAKQFRLMECCENIVNDDNTIFWNKALLLYNLNSLNRVEAFLTYTDNIYISEALEKCAEQARAVLRSRIVDNTDGDIYYLIITSPKLILTLFSDHLTLFDTFLSQVERVEFEGGISGVDLNVFVICFLDLTQSESRRMVFSQQMIETINTMSPNQQVTLLDVFSKKRCRAVEALSVICQALTMNCSSLTVVKYNKILSCLSVLNFHHPGLINSAIDACIASYEKGELTVQSSCSMLRCMRKLRFKDDQLVNIVSTLMNDVIRRLLMTPSEQTNSQDCFLFVDYLNTLSNLNVKLKDIESISVDELRACCLLHDTHFTHPNYLKSLASLNIITDEIFTKRKQHVVRVLGGTDSHNDADSKLQFEMFCMLKFYAEAVITGLPSALQLAPSLDSVMNQAVDWRRDTIEHHLSNNTRDCRVFFQSISSKLQLPFKLLDHLGLGYIEDVITFPQYSSQTTTWRGIALVCPTVAESVNMYEELSGVAELRISHIKALGYFPFIVNPRHWMELESWDEKEEYLEAKWTLEVEPILQQIGQIHPHLSNT